MDAGRHGSRSPCGLFSLLLAATGTPPRSSEDATPPLFPGLIGLGRVASFLPCVPLLRGPRTWFRVAAVVGVEGHPTRCVVRLSSRPRRPSGTASARSSRSKRPSCFVARPRPFNVNLNVNRVSTVFFL
ncbi:hypothetical protein NDU88_002185 [Pleurodeles waltl]|uniref:Secreted protein n=1 Tax=Pleurodeles waltl TaxID=8319 RepID=A0AAV7P633_PLEWA|nr:hypothetical protein NDU88_002185 [Pleurodeles waltl]